MAIPGIPQNLYVSQGNGEVLLQWDIVAGASSYSIQQSTDGVTFTEIDTATVNNYTDSNVTIGTLYYYQVASTNGSGTSPYTEAQKVVPAPTAELSLLELRQRAQERADRVNSNFVTLPEWNFFIDQAMYELYDLLITTSEDLFLAEPASFQTNGSTFMYPLPNGVLSFTNSSGNSFVASPFYKLSGVDLALNTSQNAYVTINKYNFIDRNRFVYPNSSSTIYGVFNMRYRMMGTKIHLIPTPSGNQMVRLWYIPRLPQLLADNDITTIGFSGWLQYVIVRAAKYALDKEESDTTKLDQELIFLKGRIEETAMNRDVGQPDTISDTRSGWGQYGGGFNGTSGGF